MGTAKKEAMRIIESLPEKASWDDIMYELYVKKKIETSLDAAAAGKVLSHDDVKKRLLSK